MIAHHSSVLAASAALCLHGFAASPLEDKGRPVAQTAALSPAGTVASFVLPGGFSANVVAAEPDIVQPIAHTMDDRGRLWVLENTNYPVCPGEKKDRILILEDNDGDGVAETRTVFFDKLSFSSGIALGHGGVWVGSPPNLLFFPRKENQDVFQGEPEIVLDGWGGQDTHETLNNFIWGPDGWLYGTHGIFTHSSVGKPGAKKEDRILINAGLWRYHPQKGIFERYAEGGSNQWGLDFNDHGQAYFAACVIPHSWQAIQGARYKRQAGAHENPFTYDEIGPIADFAYEKRAYCGAMIYLGGQWPEQYRNTFFFGDIHMNRMRNERHEQNGSGSKAVKNGDFLVSEDPWYRGLSPQYGPDGSVFINDWYDRVPCHQQREYTDRGNGRIYRVTYGKPAPVKVDLGKATSAELVAHQLNRNDWHVRHARRILAERGPDKDVHSALKAMLAGNPDATRKLRALWALHVTGGLDEKILLSQLSADSEYLRAWAIQLACEDGNPSDALIGKFSEMAKSDPSAIVRRYLASAAGRLETGRRKGILIALAAHAEDAKDPNIPQLLWYAAERLAAADHAAAIELLDVSGHPLLTRNIARRLSEKADPAGLSILVRALGKTTPDAKTVQVLAGMNLSLKGRKNVAAPPAWTALHARFSESHDKTLREQAKSLAAVFGGAEVIAAMQSLVTDANASEGEKLKALENLIAIGDPALGGMLLPLLHRPDSLRIVALRALPDFPAAQKIPAILSVYGALSPEEKTAALATLASNKEGTAALLKAVDEGRIPIKDLSAQLVRQIQGTGDEAVKQWISKNWGSVKKTSGEKQKEMAEYRKFLGEQAIMDADASRGRLIFSQRCAACHTLHGEGTKIGPELPGNFKDIDYLLLNLIDPNQSIGKDYQQSYLEKTNGQVVAGIIISDSVENVVLKTLAGDVSVPRGEIRTLTTSEQSMMPEGLLKGLEEPEVRDLFLYLRQSEQVPLAAE
jgi:putative membrane-bound dehydrogenase-like protein